MKLNYLLKIDEPKTHYVKVRLKASKPEKLERVQLFLPSWSPGSYLMREYARNIRHFEAKDMSGAPLPVERKEKGVYELQWDHPEFPVKGDEFEVEYEVYCHEISVRTSFVDETHAFIHGPSVFMGVLNAPHEGVQLEVRFPESWSKITTGLKDISPERQRFVYEAPNYDDFIDCPLEIGCHETDGFRVNGFDHELAFYGQTYPHDWPVKKDMQTIVETVSKIMGEIPYDKYTFITHFAPNMFGGLEHKNSTALHFCSQRFADRKSYVMWLSLVAHEYFHTWNVKRIRPIELGPFDYLNEAYTKMHWLTEGLTSFMDELFVYRSGLCSLEEYLEMQKTNLQRYFATPGRRFHTLEDSSFLAWIKLYRPDENSSNSTVSYYLKGGLVFFILNKMLVDEGSSIQDLLHKLWARYKSNPKVGVVAEEVYKMIEELAGTKVREKFEMMVVTTEEIELEATWREMGVELEFEKTSPVHLGARFKFEADRAIVESIELDGPAYKSGLNAGDELLALNGLRVLKSDVDQFTKSLYAGKTYELMVSRSGHLHTIELTVGEGVKVLKSLQVVDAKKADKYLK